MKKLILIVAVAFLGVMACKKKEEPAPEVKKYVYTRTPGEVSQIVGDIFVDTGGTVFTVKGKNFDPKRKKYYHLLMDWEAANKYTYFIINGYTMGNFADTGKIVAINDTSIIFRIDNKKVYSVRSYDIGGGRGNIKDTVSLTFAVTSIDSTNRPYSTKYDVLGSKKVRNQLFFNILKDTLTWHTKNDSRYPEKVITTEDVLAGFKYGDNVEIYFDKLKLNTSNNRANCAVVFADSSLSIGDCYFVFGTDFFNDNKSLGLTDGFYNITMKEKRTGLPIEEKHGKKGVYVKFVD